MVGHNIPQVVIIRRYSAGISNLFNLFMNEVDSWMIYDNSDNAREKIVWGSISDKRVVLNELKYKIIQSYVRKRI